MQAEIDLTAAHYIQAFTTFIGYVHECFEQGFREDGWYYLPDEAVLEMADKIDALMKEFEKCP